MNPNLEDFWNKIENNEVPDLFFCDEILDRSEENNTQQTSFLNNNDESNDECSNIQIPAFDTGFHNAQKYVWLSRSSPRKKIKSPENNKNLFPYECRLCGQCLTKDGVELHENVCVIRQPRQMPVESPPKKRKGLNQDLKTVEVIEIKEKDCWFCGAWFAPDKLEKHKPFCRNAAKVKLGENFEEEPDERILNKH